MDKQEIQKKIEKLKKEIEEANYAYYVLDNPKISDAEWDSLFHELKNLEDLNPEFRTIDSPTVRVGGKILDKFSKVLHKEKMKSLNDVKTKEEMQD